MISSLRLIWRQHRRVPLYAASTLLIYALGIALLTALVTLSDRIAFRPVAGLAPGVELVTVGKNTAHQDFGGMSPEEFESLSAALPGVAASAAWLRSASEVRFQGETHRGESHILVGDYFDGFGVRMARGRGLRPSDQREGAEPVVVISHALWRRLGRPEELVGGILEVDGASHRVLGIAAPGFRGLGRLTDAQVWVAAPQSAKFHIRTTAERLDWAGLPFFRGVMRLQEGTTLAELRAAARSVTPTYRQGNTGATPGDAWRLVPGGVQSLGAYRTVERQAWLLTAGGAVLFLTCLISVAGFFLSRAPARAGEIRTRLALGASRGSVLRMLMLEAALFSLIASAVGFSLAGPVLDGLLSQPPFDKTPALQGLTPDLRSLAVIAGVLVAASIALGIAPATTLLGRRTRLTQDHLHRAPGRHRLMQGLVVVQIALGITMGTLAALFAANVHHLEHRDLGFDLSGLHQVEAGPPDGGGYSLQVQPGWRITEAILERAASLGMDVAVTSQAPFSGRLQEHRVAIADAPDEVLATRVMRVSDNYFRFMGLELTGRGFDGSEAPGAVISEGLARRLFGSAEAALGQRLVEPFADAAGRTIVGVAEDARYEAPHTEPAPMLYLRGHNVMDILVREPEAGIHEVFTPVIQQFVPRFVAHPPENLRIRMQAQLREHYSQRQLVLVTAAGIITLLLLGIHGVLAFQLRDSQREIAIRMALGATPLRVASLLIARSGTMLAIAAATAIPLIYVSVMGVREMVAPVLDGLAWFGAGAVVAIGMLAMLATTPVARRAASTAPGPLLNDE